MQHFGDTSYPTDLSTQPSRPIQPSLKVENKFIGAILSFFGQAIKVQQENGNVNYVRISELKKRFLLAHFREVPPSEARLIRNDKIINDLFLSTINPLKGAIVSNKTLANFSQKMIEGPLNYSSEDPKKLYATLRKIRASLHTRDGMANDQKQFITNIQLGDIIFHRTDDTVYSDIVQFQKVATALGFGAKHRDSPHHNHVYMCAKIDEFGKKWFAEAAWPSGKDDEIRLVSEDDIQRCFIKQNHGAISEIFRCSDNSLALNAAAEACQITTQLEPQEVGTMEKQPTTLRYSIADGAKALFHLNNFGNNAKTRLFQWIQSTKNGGIPIDFIKPKAFFCSSLVGYAFQLAEARPIVEPLVQGSEWGKCGLINRIHSRVLALRHGRELDHKMRFKIDTKYSTPGDLYGWLSEHKELFTSIQSYQQPHNTEQTQP